MEVLKGFGRLFYIVHPNGTAFPKVEDIPQPDYVNQAIPYFITLILLEYIIQYLRNKPTARINDGVTSLSHGIYLGCGQLLFRGIEHYAYIELYDNWRLYELPWDSPYTWYAAALLTDFGYYWLHRASHEINIFWSQHQVHHSSEDMNLTTAIRQSAFQGWIGWIFYLPMAFFVPPSIFLIHQQFNLLFQFWIHTELVDSLGPLEFILNSPRHHRIHHGSNRYCIDKNYAGVLIIWDRIFGTFADEKRGEKIIYGLVEEVNSFNPFWLQFSHLKKIWTQLNAHSSWSNKFSVIFKGPGWSPGKSRLGDVNDLPVFPIRKTFDPVIPTWKSVYVLVHFIGIIIGFDILTKYQMVLSQWTVICGVGFILISLTSLGLVLENKKIGITLEVIRCLFGSLISTYVIPSSSSVFLNTTYLQHFIFGFYTASIVIVTEINYIFTFKHTKK